MTEVPKELWVALHRDGDPMAADTTPEGAIELAMLGASSAWPEHQAEGWQCVKYVRSDEETST